MVLQKRLYYGFDGYQLPPVPRAARSPRRRRFFKKKAEDNAVCVFDLLATIAGKLLLEKETSHSSSSKETGEVPTAVAMESPDEYKQVKVELHDQGKCGKEVHVSDLDTKADNKSGSSREGTIFLNESVPELALSSTSDCVGGLVSERVAIGKAGEEMSATKVEGAHTGYGESNSCKIDRVTDNPIKDEPVYSGNSFDVAKAGMRSSEDAVIADKPCHKLFNSDSRFKLSLDKKYFPGSCNTSRDNVKVVSRDDDENSSGCIHPKVVKSSKAPSRVGGRRIRKLLASKHWRVSPRYSNDGYSRPSYHNRRISFKRQRSPRDYPFKKRKFLHYCSATDSFRGLSSDGTYHSPRKGNNEAALGSTMNMRGVKLRIKSFRVPELLIEIPETATIGSLKRTVMDAVTALLGGELHIGVLVQGKKIKDDNKTLLQTGISNENQPDALGFSLEPNLAQTSQPLCSKDPSPLLPCSELQSITRKSPTPAMIHQQNAMVPYQSHLTNAGNFVDSDHESAPSIDSLTETNSKALVAVPAMDVDALAVVPANPKAKRCEAAQRRIRRPFSVAEVEALVQAVEKLGTGRWRDVKLRAFENAEHRTYVDLKDKWKTLVHTARISPQQRRGEPVPQELLDRVLKAHAYWSQQQAKQQHKQQHADACLLR